MKINKFKSLVSLILAVLIMLPSFNVFATDTKVTQYTEQISDKQQTVNDNNLVNDEEDVQREEVQIEEDGQSKNVQAEEEQKFQDNEQDEDVINDINKVVEDNTNPELYSESDESIVGELYDIVEEVIPYNYKVEEEFERVEFQLKYESLYESNKVRTKTDSNYEIALAYKDGSYRYVDNSNTIEEAKEIVKATEEKLGSNEIMPVVFNREGQVVYSTVSMGKVLKHIGGAVDPTFNNNSNIYTTSSLSSAYTYINHGYIEDVPVIEDTGKAAKVEIAGYKGWINKDTDLIIVPVNQVTNPSYYVNEGGILKHFISSDLTSTVKKGHTINVGLAPKYLKENVKYLSYDGNYFYEGSNITNGLTNLITDLKTNSKGKAVNSNSKYHSYFNYLPFRSRTTLTAEELNSFIEANTTRTDKISKLKGTGQAFIDAQTKYGVNALIALGIAINESGWGYSTIAQSKNNLFGINAVDSSPGESANYYKNVETCINEFTKYVISRGYADPADWRYYGGHLGNKYMGANVKYASDPFWGEKAAAYAFNADLYAADNKVEKLKDYNALTVIKYTGTNKVINSNKTLLYNITSTSNNGRIDSMAVVTDKNPKLMNGKYYLEIYPERDTPVGSGGSANKFAGEYNWNNKGYIESKNLVFINAPKTQILPMDPSNANKWKESDGKRYFYDADGLLARGWKNIDGKWYYFDKNSAVMKKGWFQDQGKWYYLNENGQMVTGLKEINNKLYYFNSNGSMHIGWKNISGKWYYFQSNGDAKIGWLLDKGKWYYLDINKQMVTGLEEINNKLYYLNNDGSMHIGWKNISGKWYYFNSNGDAKIGWLLYKEKWYYLDINKQMVTGLKEINNKLYYLNSDGEMQIGWKNISGKWYYFNSNGDAKIGWLLDVGKWYYLKSNAEMATGWVTVKEKDYYFYSSGAMAVNTTIDGIKIGSDGAARK